MKYLIFIILITSYGCKKCADCTTTVTQTATGQQPILGTSTSEMCGDDLDEADGYRNVATSTVQGVTVTITTETHCN